MATLQYVVNAIDGASGTFAKIALSAEDLSKQVDDLAKKRANIPVDLNDKMAQASLKDLDLKLTKLKEKVTDPEVNVKGLESAYFGIGRLDVALDRIGAKNVTAHVTVDVDRSKLNRLTGGLLGAAGSGAGAGAGTAPLGSLAAPASGSLGALGNPYVLGGAAAAVAATAPFAATAAAGSLVTVMGGAFTAIAVIAAAQNKKVAKSFTDLKTSAVKDIEKISTPFQGVLENIAKQAQKTLPQLMKPLGDSIKTIAGPFQQFATTLIKSFGSPAVAKSIRDMGGAFGNLLKALTPMLPSMINSIADGIDGIAQAIKAHPQIFADMINFLVHLVGWSLQAIGALTRVANWLVVFTRDVGHWLRVAWDDFAGFFTYLHQSAIATENMLASVWNTIWRNTVTRVQNGIADVVSWFQKLPGRVGGILATLRSNIAGAWNTIWNNTVTRVQNGINSVVNWFKGLPGKVVNALTGLGHTLGNFAAAALTEMWNGFKRIGGSITSWFSNFGKTIISVVKKVLGVFSPSSVFFDIGVNLMKGLANGVKHGVGAAQSAAQAAARKVANVGAGVQRWAPLVTQALRMEGLSPGLLRNVLYQMMTESGGNPNIVNTWDSNAAAGTPSMGLMQVIMPTFESYHVPGTSWNILNPLANIAAAINYARHVYGPSLMSGGMGIGSGHGYDSGGWLMPGATLAVNTTGAPEAVVGGQPLARVEALLAQILAATRIAPSATSAGTARALNSAARAAVR